MLQNPFWMIYILVYVGIGDTAGSFAKFSMFSKDTRAMRNLSCLYACYTF